MANRNVGIDALRMVSMLFVVILHCLGHGGILENSTGLKAALAYGLEALSYCAVNCFVLITGYCSCKSVIKSRRIVSLWVQAFFYSVVIALCFWLVGSQTLSAESAQKAVTPILSNQWWFFTQYIALVFIMPILNKALDAFRGVDAKMTLVVLFAAFSLVPLISGTDLFELSGGYSFAWFVLLYFAGASLRKLAEEGWHPSALKSAGMYLLAVLITWLPMAASILNLGAVSAFCKTIPSLYSYTSPTVLISSIALLCAFKEMNIRSDKAKAIIEFVAPSVFPVYLISDHRLVRAAFITDAFIPAAKMNGLVMVGIVIGCALAIFVACVAIEKLRVFLFDVLKISRGITVASEKIDDRMRILLERKN